MNLALLLFVFSIGNVGEIFAKSLVPSAIRVQDSGLADIREMKQNDQEQLTGNDISYFDNPADPLDIQTQEFNNKQVYNYVNDVTLRRLRRRIEQIAMLAQPQPTTNRGKRFIPQGSRIIPCLFKICNMGRKRQHPVW